MYKYEIIIYFLFFKLGNTHKTAIKRKFYKKDVSSPFFKERRILQWRQ